MTARPGSVTPEERLLLAKVWDAVLCAALVSFLAVLGCVEVALLFIFGASS